MGTRFRETERKYEAAGDGRGPVRPDPADLGDLPEVAATHEPAPVRLDAVYFDTPGLDLAAHRRTLRRRTGGDDEGWHLKLPAAEADTRTEVRAPLGRAGDAPPEELRAEVAAVVRGRPLAPVARLRTERRRVLLLAGDGRTLAEIAYDKVTASVPAEGAADARETAEADTGRKGTRSWTEADRWTEVEVELAEGTPELLDAVEERFAAAGLRRSRSGSKLARALGDDRPPVPPPPPEPVVTAGQVATAYLHAQVTAILALDPAVRRDEEDAVHRMRVATRRARSAMKSFRRELDREVTDPIGAELKWLAAVLGGARDREVLAARLGARLAELESGQAGPDVRRRLLDPGDHRAAHAAVVTELDGSRYFALLDALEALLAAPPYRRRAADPAAEAAAATVRRDHTRLRHAVEAALALPPGQDRDVALHEARKDAKRARYSSEAARIVLGGRAAAHTARMKGVQQLLGEHQDSVMCRAAVAEAREQARAAGEDTAPYQALARREREIAADIEARLPGEWRAADRPL